MAISLVSCSLDDLGGFMGFMSKNVYGIKANMKDVKDATKKIDDAVTIEGDDVTIDLDKAATIIDNIGDISASPQKTEEFKKELAKPVSEAKGDAVKAELEGKVTAVLDEIEDLPDPAPGSKEEAVVNKVKEILDMAQSSISDNPTKADLATVAVINDMANLAKTIAKNADYFDDPDKALEAVDKGLSAINTLKIVSEVTGVNLLEGIDFTSILSDAGKSRDGENEDLQKYFAMAAKNVAKLVSLITKDGELDYTKVGVIESGKYIWVLSQAHAIMASYEMMAMPYIDPASKTDLKKLDKIFGNTEIKRDLTPDDLILYFECLMMTSSHDDDTGDWDNALKEFIHENYEALMDLGNKTIDFDSTVSQNLITEAEKAMDRVTDKTKSWNKLGTVAVLIAKSNWDKLLLDAAGVKKFSELVEKMK